MTPPINIDGTQITGASIDGQTVSEITVDGTQVFSASTIPASGLTHRWPLDEGSGSTFRDTESSITGDIVGATWRSGIGNGGNYLEFDGSDDVANTNALPPTGGNPRTIAMWINANTSSGDMAIGGYGDNAQGKDFRWFTRSGSLRFEIGGTGETSTLSPTVGSWEPTAIVVPSSSFSDITLFHNGSTFDMSDSGTVDTGTNNNFKVGVKNLSSPTFGDLEADDPVVWDRALSVSELNDWVDATNSDH